MGTFGPIFRLGRHEQSFEEKMTTTSLQSVFHFHTPIGVCGNGNWEFHGISTVETPWKKDEVLQTASMVLLVALGEIKF